MNKETETETEEPTADECAQCGCEAGFERDGRSIWDAKGNVEDVCTSCYDAHVHTCQLCSNEMMPHESSGFIVVKVELGQCDHPSAMPGIYRVRSRPFLSVPTIGSPSMDSGDLLFIDVLPRPDHTFEISGHICCKCAKPYQRIYGETYGQLTRRKLRKKRARRHFWHNQSHSAAQLRRVTFAFRQLPERLKDLECEPDELQDDYPQFQLPATRTYHEFVLMRRNGVTVYKCHREDDGSSWVLLRGEPRYRGMCYGAVFYNGQKLDQWVRFCGSGLPTYKKPEPCEGSMNYVSSSRTLMARLQAIRDAIDQGILRQDGVWVDGSRTIIY